MYDPEKKKAAWRRWYLKHREERLAKCKEYRLANRDKVKATNHAWQKANPDKVKASWARHYAKHREERIARTMSWKKRNPEMVAANNMIYSQRRKTLASISPKTHMSKNKKQKPKKALTKQCKMILEYAKYRNAWVDGFIRGVKAGAMKAFNKHAAK